jgi:hypothetical protein
MGVWGICWNDVLEGRNIVIGAKIFSKPTFAGLLIFRYTG